MRKIIMLTAIVVLIISALGGLWLSQQVLGGAAKRPPQGPAIKNSVVSNVYKRPSAAALLQDSLLAAGVRMESVYLEGWARLAPVFMNRDVLADAARRSAALLGLEAELALQTQQENNFLAFSWEGEVDPGIILYLSVQSLKSAAPRGETYLLLNVKSQPGPDRDGSAILNTWEERFLRVFQAWQVEPHLTFNLIGVVPGRLSQAAGEELAENIILGLGARRVEGISGPGLISISAYTPRLPGKVEVAGKKINLNVALRYHSLDDLTYIHLGSPLLSGEY